MKIHDHTLCNLGQRLPIEVCSCHTRWFEPAGACFDEKRKRRFALWRNWDPKLPLMAVCMLNPSVADEQDLDPTLRRVYGFARAWKFGGMVIVNAFARISTDPRQLQFELRDDVNDAHVNIAACMAERIMAGWGNNLKRRDLRWRLPELRAILARHDNEEGGRVMAWRLSLDGTPMHPLYLPDITVPVPYRCSSA